MEEGTTKESKVVMPAFLDPQDVDHFKLEAEVSMALNFDFGAPTIHSFIIRYLHVMQLEESEEMTNFAYFLGDIAAAEMNLLEYRPSLLATAAVHLCHCMLRETRAYHDDLRLHSEYEYYQVKKAVDDLVYYVDKTKFFFENHPRQNGFEPGRYVPYDTYVRCQDQAEMVDHLLRMAKGLYGERFSNSLGNHRAPSPPPQPANQAHGAGGVLQPNNAQQPGNGELGEN